MGLIKSERSIIPACDVNIDLYETIIKYTSDIPEVSAYKIGFELALVHGLPKIINLTRRYTDKLIIYDHQKGCTDTPYKGEKFVKTLVEAGIDAAIFFPLTGPETELAWIKAAFKFNLPIIIGGDMSHYKYRKSEGGYIDDMSVAEIYSIAAKMGITDFVVPGNKPDRIKEIKNIIESNAIKPNFYAPGFGGKQGGSILNALKSTDNKLHAIIGEEIYTAKSIRAKVLDLVNQLNILK